MLKAVEVIASYMAPVMDRKQYRKLDIFHEGIFNGLSKEDIKNIYIYIYTSPKNLLYKL